MKKPESRSAAAAAAAASGDAGALVRRLACATAGTTFVLVLAGALVTSKDAGLAVPDWPTTYGYNMFTFPPSRMEGGILYEHSHRLLGAAVGLLTFGLAIAVFRRERRKSIRALSAAAAAGVVAQGVLGGLRVIRLDIDLAVLHGAVAQAFFALVATIAVLTRPALRRCAAPGGRAPDPARLRSLAVASAALVYAQIVAGALLRHRGARLDVHLGLALVVSAAVGSLALRAALARPLDAPSLRPLRAFALAAGALLVLQLFLGLGAYATTFAPAGTEAGGALEVGLTVAHVAVGALLFATCVSAAVLAFRLLDRPARRARRTEALRAAEGAA